MGSLFSCTRLCHCVLCRSRAWSGWCPCTTTIWTAFWLTRWVSAKPSKPSLSSPTWWSTRDWTAPSSSSSRCRQYFSPASASPSNVCSERRNKKPEKCVKLCHLVIRFQIAALIRLPSLSQYWLWTTVVLAHQKACWLLHLMMRFPLIHLFRPFVCLVCKNGSRSHTSLAAPRPPVWKTKLLLFYRSKTLTQTYLWVACQAFEPINPCQMLHMAPLRRTCWR